MVWSIWVKGKKAKKGPRTHVVMIFRNLISCSFSRRIIDTGRSEVDVLQWVPEQFSFELGGHSTNSVRQYGGRTGHVEAVRLSRACCLRVLSCKIEMPSPLWTLEYRVLRT